ncbi:SOS response-associated peptidase [Salegentibacter sediminis]|uniref:SOS response-associated peptidase n=1 Tax=Salegentibacter sediminis TaxID=1930251 RepID=UPI0009BFD916|nr:SOS response-associated peptidase [Salegentibacter sediminis]
MCYRTKLNAKLSDIERAFDARFIEAEAYEPREEINAFSFIKTPVVIDENPREIEMFNWGLIPFWAKDEKIRKMTLNARIESLSEKPAFRNSIENRCLVIANGYYEWQWKDAKGKEKQKFLITPQEQDIFAFAGIYSSWTNPKTNKLVNSYSIVTTKANELMSEIHNHKQRMPVVLKKKDQQLWLSGKEVSQFAFPYEVKLNASPL